MVFITSLGDHGWFWLLMGVLLFSFPRTRLLGGCMLISIAAGFLLGNVLLKNMAARQRPCWLDPSVELLVRVPKDFSFPSGHSLVSFEGAVCIFLFNRKWGIPALMLAVLIAFSRLYLFVHFPTDVLAGIIMGTVIAWSVVRTAKRRTEKTDRVDPRRKSAARECSFCHRPRRFCTSGWRNASGHLRSRFPEPAWNAAVCAFQLSGTELLAAAAVE